MTTPNNTVAGLPARLRAMTEKVCAEVARRNDLVWPDDYDPGEQDDARGSVGEVLEIAAALASPAPSAGVVDDAMVERALAAYGAICKRDGQDEDYYPDAMCAALTAALSGVSAPVGVEALPLEAATEAGLTCDDLLTEWIPGTIKPTTHGTYLRQFDEGEFDEGATEALSSWNGIDQWNTGEAADFFSPASPVQERPWRGVCPRKLEAALTPPAAAPRGEDHSVDAIGAGRMPRR